MEALSTVHTEKCVEYTEKKRKMVIIICVVITQNRHLTIGLLAKNCHMGCLPQRKVLMNISLSNLLHTTKAKYNNWKLHKEYFLKRQNLKAYQKHCILY